MRKRSKIFIAAALVFAAALAVYAKGEVDVSPEVMELHRDAFVLDLHADTHFMITYMGFDMSKRHRTVDWGPAGVAPLFSDIDIPRAKEGGLDMFNISICPSPKNNRMPGATWFVNNSLRALEKTFEKHSDLLAPARTPTEAREIVASGRHAVLLGVEGGQGISENLDVLRGFYDKGVRYMTLTHAKTLSWAESASDGGAPSFNGLTEFGKDVVREMEKMGMIIDLAHVSPETFWATLDTVEAPVVVTHAAARGIADHPRNLTDEQILAVAERGGVIGVIFYDKYLDPTGTKPRDVTLIVDHIDYIKELAGVDVIALGSDYDGSVNIPPDLGNASRLPNLTAELVRRGYTDEEIKKILGENFMRTWQKIIDHGE